MSAAAKASGGKRAAAAKDPAEVLVSDKRRRERDGMDDSDHEFDRCLALPAPHPSSPPLSPLAFRVRCFGFAAGP